MRAVMRRLLSACLLPLLLALGLLLAASAWLWMWVPTHGKLWLETQMEQALPLDVSIGALRYAPWEGIVLDRLELRDRTDPSLVWLTAPRVLGHVDLLPLLLSRAAQLRLAGRLQIPCEAEVTAVIKAGLSNRRLEASILTSDIRLQDIQPPVARLLPSSLKEGRVRLAFRLKAAPNAAVSIEGHLPVSHLVWMQQGVQFAGDVDLKGVLQPMPTPESPWSGHIELELLTGTLNGVPALEPIRQLRGTARITPKGIQIASLTGQVDQIPWTLTGFIGLDADHTAELYATSTVQLEEAAPHLWPGSAAWQPAGLVDITAVCRGPLAHWPNVELQATGKVRDGALTAARPYRADHISATLQYDHLADTLTIDDFSAQVQDAAVTAHGMLHPLTPPQLHLEVRTSGDLAQVQPLLPAEHPIRAMRGPFTATFRIEGPAAAPVIEGEATVDGASLETRGWPQAVEALRGTVRATADRLDAEHLSFTIAGQPLTAAVHLTQWRSHPEITVDAVFPNGTLTFTGRAGTEAVEIHAAEAVVGASRVRITGTLGRGPKDVSSLQIRGTLDLHDLSTVPWLPAKPLAAWQAQGRLDIQLAVSGRLDEWAGTTILGAARSEQLIVRDVPIESLAMDVEQRERKLTLRVASAMVAEGKLSGQVVLDQQESPARFLVEADATRLNLSRLAEALPSWRERHIDGMASTHLSLLGRVNDRAGWHGDGWIDAEGEHLGELPMFDRLFRGVFGALADRLGLTALRKARLVKVTGQWQLLQRRIRTDDLQLHGEAGTAPVVVMFRGSVGLDKTLDFLVEPNLPDQLILEAPNTSTLSRALLRVVGGLERLRQTIGQHHLGGTIDKPDYQFQVSLDQLLNQLMPSRLERLLDSLH